jgi:hypothetical protein
MITIPPDDPLFVRARAAVASSRHLIREAELAKQTAKSAYDDRLHIALETARTLRRAEQYMFELRRIRTLPNRS